MEYDINMYILNENNIPYITIFIVIQCNLQRAEQNNVSTISLYLALLTWKRILNTKVRRSQIVH